MPIIRAIPRASRAFAALCLGLAVPWPLAAQPTADSILHLRSWQAPAMLNPYLSAAAKDVEAASIVLDPLARTNAKGTLVAWLAKTIPTRANGGISADGTAITWRLRDGLEWSDGTSVTAADVAFTWEYCMAEGAGCAQAMKFDGVARIDTPDAHTVTLRFDAPRPMPYQAFVGPQSPILQKAQFADCLGPRAQSCSAQNSAPIGTGPFVVEKFQPGNLAQFSANRRYRHEGRPAFDRLTLQGGGDTAAAARAVLQTGEADFASNLQLPPEVLRAMQARGRGKLVTAFGPLLERLVFNLTDPDAAHAKARSTRAHPHPILSDIRVRKALALALDRAALVDLGYGPAGRVTCALIPAPARFAQAQPDDCAAQNLEAARALLDQAGWRDRDGDGLRDKKGKALRLRFQTSANAVRQDFQVLIQEWWRQIGVATELRAIDAGIFFGSDPSTPDTYQKFFADVQMFASAFDGTDPGAFLGNWRCDGIPRPENGWQGPNIARICDPAYDALADQLARSSAPKARVRLVQRMSQHLTDSHALVPLVHRGRVAAHGYSLKGVRLNPWDSPYWNIAEWHRAP
jgi:peptide/nickel transport system substrate-binding protein